MGAQTFEQIEGFFLSTTEAISTLYEKNLLPHSLVVIYSTIDICGLLDAKPSQTNADSASFKAWVKKYVLAYPGLELNEIDLWAARCGVLHTFTSHSKLSSLGKARELKYYTGDKTAPHIQQFINFTKSHEDGKYLPVNYVDLVEAVFTGLKAFLPDLHENCMSSTAHGARLRNVLQTYAHQPTPKNPLKRTQL